MWRFCGDGGGRFTVGVESCCEAGLRLFERKDVFLVAFESNVSRRENAQCRWESLRYDDEDRFFEIDFVFT